MRVCRKFDIRTVFTTMSTLRQQLTKVKLRHRPNPQEVKRGVQDTLQLRTGVHKGKLKEVMKPASMNIRHPPDEDRRTSQQLQSMPGKNNTSPNGITSPYLTTHGTTPPCWSRKHYTSHWQGNTHSPP